jgi:hypothetical protein
MPSGRLDSKKNLLPPLREKFVLDIPFHRTAEAELLFPLLPRAARQQGRFKEVFRGKASRGCLPGWVGCNL